MTIQTKYEIGDRVWVVYAGQNSGEVQVYDDVISDIAVDKDGVTYLTKETSAELNEDEVILYNEKDKLVDKVIKTMEEIRKSE